MRINFNRPAKSHKGTFGTTLVVGGNSGSDNNFVMLGAPALAGLSAHKTGVGKVFISSEESIIKEIITITPASMGLKYSQLCKTISKVNAVIVGCGWGITKENQKILHEIINRCSKENIPVVIDADGLNNLCLDPTSIIDHKSDIVLTPHTKELERLLTAFNSSSAMELSKKLNCFILHKDFEINIYSPTAHHIKFSKPNSKLSIAGSGDVLSGILGGFLTLNRTVDSKYKILELCHEAVTLHSEAGEKLAFGDTAFDLVKVI